MNGRQKSGTFSIRIYGGIHCNNAIGKDRTSSIKATCGQEERRERGEGEKGKKTAEECKEDLLILLRMSLAKRSSSSL